MPVLRIDAHGKVLEHNKASAGILEHWGISGHFPKGGAVLSLVQECIKCDQEVTDQLHYEERTYSLLYAPVADRGYCNIFISDVSEITESRNQAEAANQAKDYFLSAVSHEMRTPVNAIIGLMSLLEKSGIREDQKHYANALNFASKNLLNLINDILDFAKAENGNLRLEERPLSCVRWCNLLFRRCVGARVQTAFCSVQKSPMQYPRWSLAMSSDFYRSSTTCCRMQSNSRRTDA